MTKTLVGLAEQFGLMLDPIEKAEPSSVQTLIFEAGKFTEDEARRWAQEHDFSTAKIDTKESSFRIRQRDPKSFKDGSFRTVKLTDGIKAVIGRLAKGEVEEPVTEESVNKTTTSTSAGTTTVNVDPISSTYDVEQLAKDLGLTIEAMAKEHGGAMNLLAQALKAPDPQQAKALIAQAMKLMAAYEDGGKPPAEELPPKGAKKTKSASGEGEDFELFVPVVKLDEEQRLVAGIVYEPDIVDAQGDSATAEEIRKAAHDFMLNSMRIGRMHKDDVTDRVRIVENYIAPCDMHIGNQRVRKGTWVMVVKVLDDALWAEVKGGSLTGFSMAGHAVDEASLAA